MFVLAATAMILYGWNTTPRRLARNNTGKLAHGLTAHAGNAGSVLGQCSRSVLSQSDASRYAEEWDSPRAIALLPWDTATQHTSCGQEEAGQRLFQNITCVEPERQYHERRRRRRKVKSAAHPGGKRNDNETTTKRQRNDNETTTKRQRQRNDNETTTTTTTTTKRSQTRSEERRGTI